VIGTCPVSIRLGRGRLIDRPRRDGLGCASLIDARLARGRLIHRRILAASLAAVTELVAPAGLLVVSACVVGPAASTVTSALTGGVASDDLSLHLAAAVRGGARAVRAAARRWRRRVGGRGGRWCL